MKKIFRIIKENFILLLGIGLFTYGLFSFNSGYYVARMSGGTTGIRLFPVTTYRYYNETSLDNLTIGAILIAIGLLKMRKREEN